MSVERVLEISRSERPRGLARPGGSMIIASYLGMLTLTIIGAIVGKGQTITGLPAAILCFGFLVAVVFNVKGFIDYGKSKGYSGWISFLLCTAQVTGAIVMLLLPDHNARDD